MLCTNIPCDVPQSLVLDFASDPQSPYDKVLLKLKDAGWRLQRELSDFVNNLPHEAVEAALADKTFQAFYGTDEHLARVWFAQSVLLERASATRLKSISEALVGDAAIAEGSCPHGGTVDEEGMVKLAEFEDSGGAVTKNGLSFAICATTAAANSSFWLLRSFYEQHVEDRVSVRLDPFLWGHSNDFLPLMFKMVVYARAVNWDGIDQLREPHHGCMTSDTGPDRSEFTEFCWELRNDGRHFVCEALPAPERITFEAGRYLHAIYDPKSKQITHFDGALRIYSAETFGERRASHVRKAGKAGIRRKIFRIDGPVDRDAFSLIAQAFFIWNEDLARYFRETLPVHP